MTYRGPFQSNFSIISILGKDTQRDTRKTTKFPCYRKKARFPYNPYRSDQEDKNSFQMQDMIRLTLSR